MSEYYTVVYKIAGDRAKHDEWWQSIRPLFMADACQQSRRRMR